MYLHKKAVLFSATGALLIPQLSFAATSMSDDKGANYNMTLLCLIGLVLILLFVIGMLANTLRQLTFVVKDKNRKEKHAAAGIAKSVLLLALLLSSAQSFAAAVEVKAPAIEFISGIPIADFYLIVGVITLELLVIFALAIYINIMLKIIRNEPALQARANVVVKKSWFWDNFNSATAIEKKKTYCLTTIMMAYRSSTTASLPGGNMDFTLLSLLR